MKKVLLLSLLLFNSAVFADAWTGKDKELHLIGGFGVASVVTAVTKDENMGFLAGAAAGLAKEIYDDHKGADVSGKDLVVTIIGSFIGAKVTGLYVDSEKIIYTKKWSFY